MSGRDVEISLDAVIVAVTDDSPRLLTVDGSDGVPALPSGILEPHDPTLERGVRRWVQDQTGLELGYVEQLYTFGDRARSPGAVDDDGARHLSIAYLALVREDRPSPGASWVDVYDLFPWEDHRRGRPKVLTDRIDPVLDAYVAAGADPDGERRQRDERVRIVFGGTGADARFDGARTLERYELLYQVGLVAESGAAGGDLVPSKTMTLDHRRITATALTRIRGKLGYRPLVFELLPSRFTLLALQRVVEALAGVRLHKQNFRRLVEGAGLVERTGEQARTGGRPAELFRFRREVLGERPRPGVGTPWVRS